MGAMGVETEASIFGPLGICGWHCVLFGFRPRRVSKRSALLWARTYGGWPTVRMLCMRIAWVLLHIGKRRAYLSACGARWLVGVCEFLFFQKGLS